MNEDYLFVPKGTSIFEEIYRQLLERTTKMKNYEKEKQEKITINTIEDKLE
jgi:hypothetical protein